MNNLIDNAIKYSNDAPSVTITLRVENEEAVIRVKDKGIGISGEDIERIFDRFYRGGDEFTRTVKGSGLGLALVRELVQAHKGTVKVTSELNKGSEFIIRLPLEKEEDINNG